MWSGAVLYSVAVMLLYKTTIKILSDGISGEFSLLQFSSSVNSIKF